MSTWWLHQHYSQLNFLSTELRICSPHICRVNEDFLFIYFSPYVLMPVIWGKWDLLCTYCWCIEFMYVIQTCKPHNSWIDFWSVTDIWNKLCVEKAISEHHMFKYKTYLKQTAFGTWCFIRWKTKLLHDWESSDQSKISPAIDIHLHHQHLCLHNTHFRGCYTCICIYMTIRY